MTFFFKFVFPAVWIPCFGAGALTSSFDAGRSSDSHMVLFIWIFGSLLLWWACAPLKKVRIVGRELCMSNYLKEICIPAEQIVEVTENRWVNIHPVTIRFRDDTPFGRTVRFMPKTQLLGFLSHPIVKELRALSTDAGGEYFRSG
jgi:hypothetical protein